MLTRGHLIGQIVDDLADIAGQAKQRARLGFTDLHVYIENFAKEVLNRSLKLSLKNLNETRSNAPGLDLGDETAGWAFQVTGEKTRAKVQATLEAITPDDRKRYPNVRILVIGEKQGSYALDGEPFASAGFTQDMIWDFDELCRKIVSLPIEELIGLQSYVADETRRVRIELEIPDKDGHYPTNIEKLVEALPKPTLSDASKIEAHFSEGDMWIEREHAEKSIKELSDKLAQLPRMTREIFRLLIERRDEKKAGFSDDFRISVPKLERIYHGDDLAGDLQLLTEVYLIDVNEADEHFKAPYWRIRFPGCNENFHHIFMEYVEAKGIDLQKVLVTLDFSDF